MSDDIRWLQRFANYTKALHSLSDAVTLAGALAVQAGAAGPDPGL